MRSIEKKCNRTNFALSGSFGYKHRWGAIFFWKAAFITAISNPLDLDPLWVKCENDKNECFRENRVKHSCFEKITVKFTQHARVILFVPCKYVSLVDIPPQSRTDFDDTLCQRNLSLWKKTSKVGHCKMRDTSNGIKLWNVQRPQNLVCLKNWFPIVDTGELNLLNVVVVLKFLSFHEERMCGWHRFNSKASLFRMHLFSR